MDTDKLDGIVALATVGSTVLGSFAYGMMDAKGTPLPGKEYVIPATAFGAFYMGQKFGLPDNGSGFGGTYLMGAEIVGASLYGLGYLIGKVN
ncbi:hypothetical protein HY837_00655 [archaeon]|nr:hypothetical protein [archaeon]